MFELLDSMINCICPSGNETPLAQLITAQLASYCDEITTDTMGNVIAHIKGNGKKLMLAAHMDQIGFMVTAADEHGFLRFAKMGGLRPAQLLGCVVEFPSGACGVVACEDETPLKELSLEKLYLDIGVKTEADALKKVPVGSTGVIKGCLLDLGERLLGTALDDKIGCLVLMEVAKQIKNPENDLYFAFTVQEELGLRGAKTAAFAIEPDFAIAIDVTSAGDIPGSKKAPLKLGEGPAIKLRDASIVCHPKVVNFLTEVAESQKINVQREVLMSGGTDAGAIHLTKTGVVTGGVSIVTRYIHSAAEMVEKKDVEDAVRLLVQASVQKID